MRFDEAYKATLPIQSNAGRGAVEKALIFTMRELNEGDYDESELVEYAIAEGIIEISFAADYLRVNDIASDIMYGSQY